MGPLKHFLYTSSPELNRDPSVCLTGFFLWQHQLSGTISNNVVDSITYFQLIFKTSFVDLVFYNYLLYCLISSDQDFVVVFYCLSFLSFFLSSFLPSFLPPFFPFFSLSFFVIGCGGGKLCEL